MPSKKAQGVHKNRNAKPSNSTLNQRRPLQGPPTKTPQNTDSVAQEILTLFRRTFSHAFTNRLTQTLQEVKGHLYNRDYLKAFGSEEYLQAYVVRWSPSRALAYRKIFLDTCEEVRKVWDGGKGDHNNNTRVVCIGGGAGAEIVAIAAAVKELVEERERGAGEDAENTPVEQDGGIIDNREHNIEQQPSEISRLRVTAIDIASWTSIISSLVAALTQGSASQTPFVSHQLFSASFHQGDILSASTTSLITKDTSLITILFTTNELFAQSTPGATAFLSSLGDRLSSGALLMIVESAGSYSMVKVGEKEYPMPWLLDLILLGGPENDDGYSGVWKKIVSDDSEWYRLPKEGLKYPIELENMRYLVRVYQRV